MRWRSQRSQARTSPPLCTICLAAPGTKNSSRSATPVTVHRSAGCMTSSNSLTSADLSARVVATTTTDADKSASEGDVGVGAPLAGVRVTDRGCQGGSGCIRGDDLVHNPNLDRPRHASGDALMLGGKLGLELRTYVVGDLCQLAPVQNANGGNRAHHSHFGSRPGKDPGRAKRACVHRDVRAAVRLAGHQCDPRHHRFAEGVQKLRAATDHSVPLLADAWQITGYVHDHHKRHPERVAHSDEPGCLL